jgi:hypothetical protein
MVEQVRTVTVQGKQFVLPEGVDVQIKFHDGDGGYFDTPEEAARSAATHSFHELIGASVDWRNEEIDYDYLLHNRKELIGLLEKLA